jgi:hypothetical protein
MEKRNVEICYCRGNGPVTRVSSCNPGLRRGRRGVGGGGAMHVGSGGFRGAQQAPAPWVRAALTLPIAAGVARTTIRRPGGIWATMASGVLVLIRVGSDADWRAKLLIYLAVEGSPLDAYSQSAFPL